MRKRRLARVAIGCKLVTGWTATAPLGSNSGGDDGGADVGDGSVARGEEVCETLLEEVMWEVAPESKYHSEVGAAAASPC